MRSSDAMGEKIIVFDIWCDFAHFRRGYTTTSSLTYPFPPKSTIAGLIAGILGIPNENAENNFYKILTSENFKIGIRILKKVNTTVIKENLINTKKEDNPLYFKYGLINPEKGRSQIPIQFLKNPKYRVYVWLKEEKLKNSLIGLLKNHKTIYTPYLGITECLANFKFVGTFEMKKISTRNGRYEIDSVVPKDAGKIKVEDGKIYGSVKMPVYINEKRETEKFCEFIYIESGNPVEEDKRKPIVLTELKKGNVNYLFASISGENVILF